MLSRVCRVEGRLGGPEQRLGRLGGREPRLGNLNCTGLGIFVVMIKKVESIGRYLLFNDRRMGTYLCESVNKYFLISN